MSVTRYMGWRRGMSGYGAGCTQTDIDNKVQATVGGSDVITGIGSFPATYIVTNIDDTNVDPSKLQYREFKFRIIFLRRAILLWQFHVRDRCQQCQQLYSQ